MAFKYQPLDPSKQQIRLLRVEPEPGDGNQAAACELHTFDFVPATRGGSQEMPTFAALSYTWKSASYPHPWGSRKNRNSATLNGQPIRVNQNLYEFLRSIAEELQHMWLWIDQLCIDQNNDTERSNQVSIMADIYSYADEVIIWLGPLDERTVHAPLVLEFIKWAGSDQRTRDIEEQERILSRSGFHRVRRHNADLLSNSYKHNVKDIKKARNFMADLPYWKRMWIVQEVVLAKKLRIRWGSYWVSWENMTAAQLDDDFYDQQRTLPKVSRLPPEVRYLGRLRRAFHQEPKVNKLRLWVVISNLYYRDCSNPRDCVYGVLGIMSKYGSDAYPRAMEIDYNKPVQEVFLDAVRAMVLTSRAELRDQRGQKSAYMPVWHFLFTCNRLAIKMLGVPNDIQDRVLRNGKKTNWDDEPDEDLEERKLEKLPIVPSEAQAELMVDLYREALAGHTIDWQDYYLQHDLPSRDFDSRSDAGKLRQDCAIPVNAVHIAANSEAHSF